MVDPSEQRPSRDKKRVIEFDMFVDDLEPEKSEEIRGGGGKGQTRQPKQEDSEKSSSNSGCPRRQR